MSGLATTFASIADDLAGGPNLTNVEDDNRYAKAQVYATLAVAENINALTEVLARLDGAEVGTNRDGRTCLWLSESR